VLFRRNICLWLVWLAVGGRLWAASPAEDRAYAAAVSAFQDAFWSRAEAGLSNFVARFPSSTNVPEAVLLEAQAQFQQRKFADAIALLSRYQPVAGALADQYAYWTGEAQYQNGDLAGAAQTFESLGRQFPESPWRLRAVIEAAAAWLQLTNAPRAAALLTAPGGALEQAARASPTNELVLRGQLLLAQADFQQKKFAGAAEILQAIPFEALPERLQWQWAYQLFQVRLAAGELNTALAVAENLLQIAQLENDDARRAEAATLKAEVLELLGRPEQAIAAYRENVTTNAPAAQQQQALLQEAAIALAHGLTNARPPLEEFLAQFPRSPARDIVLLTLGELTLKVAAGPPPDTNGLQAAQARFDQFLQEATNAAAALRGRAYLDRGWCLWLTGNLAGSLADFEAATNLLPPSPDLAVARFKIGDVLFAQNQFAAARDQYRAVAQEFIPFPEVVQNLVARALYQSLRASLELKDESAAGVALAQMVAQYPSSSFAPASALLYGEGLADWQEPAAARRQFQKFETEFPHSPLRAQAELAIARTYEQEHNWSEAIAAYENWLQSFPTNEFRPQASYALARAEAQAGQTARALAQFTNFVARFPASPLAPLAEWWVADYYYGTGTNYADAEKNYEGVFQNWPSSELACPARLMAGRAAAGRGGYSDARHYFRDLKTDTNCPPEVRAQAFIEDGNVLTRMDSADTNNPLANFQLATNVFAQVSLLFPGDDAAVLLADCRLGDCDLQLNNFDAATNAYARVFQSTNAAATVALRSRARIGFGLALEKKAALVAGAAQTALLQQALNSYLDVFDTWTGHGLRPGETADPFWVKEAGLRALPLMEQLGTGNPDQFIARMETLFPQSRDALEKVRAALPDRNAR